MVGPTQLAQLVVNGLVLGSILSLTAVGLTLVYGILDLANFAHGDFITLGAYVVFTSVALWTRADLLMWALTVAIVLVAVVGWDRLLADPAAGVASDTPLEAYLPGGDRLTTTETTLLLYLAALIGVLVVSILRPVRVPMDVWTPLLALALAASFLPTLREAPDARRPRRTWSAAAAGGVVLLLALLGLPAALGRPGMDPGWALLVALIPALAAGVRLHPDPMRDHRVLATVGVGGLAAAYVLRGEIYLSALLGVLAVAGLGAALDVAIWRRMRERDAGLLTLIIISIGLAMVVRNLIQVYWTGDIRVFPGPVQRARPILGTDVVVAGSGLLVMGVAGLSILTVHVILRRTKVGKAMRALSDDMELARVAGIDVDRIILYVWVLAGVLAALSGVLLGLIRPIQPELGWRLLLPIFAAVILGGIGSAYGAMAGGLIIGIAMQSTPLLGLPSRYSVAVGFAIMILTLLVRPQGIAGRSRT